MSFRPSELLTPGQLPPDLGEVQGTFIYVAAGGYNRIRLGISKNPLATNKRGSLLYVAATDTDGVDILGFAHGYLKSYVDQNGWLRCPPEMATAAINAAAAHFNHRLLSVNPADVARIVSVAAQVGRAKSNPVDQLIQKQIYWAIAVGVAASIVVMWMIQPH